MDVFQFESQFGICWDTHRYWHDDNDNDIDNDNDDDDNDNDSFRMSISIDITIIVLVIVITRGFCILLSLVLSFSSILL